MRLSIAYARMYNVRTQAYGATESPDTGLMVVPWVILDW